ncbi:VOC family protein [Paraglaciecola sp. Hal342]
MKMDYCVLGTNNMDLSIQFYNSLFEGCELNHVLSTERMSFWQCDEFAFAIAKPFDGAPASNGNGTMIGFNVGSSDEVERLHSKAIELGGSVRVHLATEGLNFRRMLEIWIKIKSFLALKKLLVDE